ncbi:MAG: hypothetical protein WB808_08590 [Candidatus Dormiibacterota bacterium]
MSVEDRLDAALGGDILAFAAAPEVPGLVDTSDEVEMALATWRIDPERRAQIYATAMAIVDASGLGLRIRALGLDRRFQALAGGAVVTLAAATAVSVAIARGRRHSPAELSA